MTFKRLLDINCILLMCLCTACNNNISDGIAVMTDRKQVAEELPVYQIPQQANNTFTLIADDNFSQGGYYYDHISDQAKIIYQVLYTGIMQKSETIEVTGQPDDQIKYAYKSLIFDHPEIFWTDGYQIEKYNRADGYKLFRPGYTKSEEECVVIKDELRAYYDKLCLTLDTSSEFKIIQGIYDYLVTHTQYDITAPDLQNITSIVNGRAVCEGYAKGTMYFAKQLGLNCICIPGYIRSSGTAHLWNAVKIDNNWYFVDTTWGDEDFENDKQAPEVRYDYLCVTSDQLNGSHQADDFVEVPICSSKEANYYYQHKQVVYQCTDAELQKQFNDFSLTGKVTFICDTPQVYQQVNDYLVNQKHIFDYLPSHKAQIGYLTNQNVLSFTFWIKSE